MKMRTNSRFTDPELVGRLDGLAYQGRVREFHEELLAAVLADPGDTVQDLVAEPARIQSVELLMQFYIDAEEYEKCAAVKAVLDQARAMLEAG
jgi:hypothetical protein